MALGRKQPDYQAAADQAVAERNAGDSGTAAADRPAAGQVSPAVTARVRELVAGIPAADEASADRLILQLLDATGMDELNAPWDSSSTDALAGRTLSIRAVSQRPSRFEDGDGVFLVVDAIDGKTGERVTFTTSAVAVVLQLARAYQLGLLPVTAEVVRAETPTERGYYPVHLRILAVSPRQAAADDGPAF